MAGPIKGEEYIFYVSLTDIFDPQFFIANPTIVTGDFMRSNDGGALGSLLTLPTVEPPGSKIVKVTLSPVEMNTDRMTIIGSDQSNDEWGDVSIFLDIARASQDNVMDLLEGDHQESSANLKIFKKGTFDILLEKDITGSLLNTTVTVNTKEPSP